MDVVQHQILSLDFWQDTVSYEGKNFPSGTIGCDALNIPAALIKQITELCGSLNLVMNHQFNWWFDYAPIRGLCLQRLKGGCLKHLYRLASKRGYLLVSSLFDSSFCC